MNWYRLLGRLTRFFRPRPTTPPTQKPPAARLDPQTAWPTLTERELQVAWCIRQGLTNQEIAGRLYISPGTVKTHVHHLLVKFDLPSRWVLREVLNQVDFSFWGAPPKIKQVSGENPGEPWR